MMLIDSCIMWGLDYDRLNRYGVREMDLFLRGVHESKKEQQRQTRRICFTMANVMGAEIKRESDMWVIDEDEVYQDANPEKIEYYKKRLIELGKWKAN